MIKTNFSNSSIFWTVFSTIIIGIFYYFNCINIGLLLCCLSIIQLIIMLVRMDSSNEEYDEMDFELFYWLTPLTYILLIAFILYITVYWVANKLVKFNNFLNKK